MQNSPEVIIKEINLIKMFNSHRSNTTCDSEERAKKTKSSVIKVSKKSILFPMPVLGVHFHKKVKIVLTQNLHML